MKFKHSSARGAALITAVFFMVMISLVMVVGLSGSAVREYRLAHDSTKSKGAYYLSEASLEDVMYRVKHGKQVDNTETLVLFGNTATTTIATNGNFKTISSLGTISSLVRRATAVMTTSPGATFSFGIQTGNGGFTLKNSSSVTGNVYANGTVTGSGSNVISGSVVSAGATGSITGISSGDSAYAHTISGSTIGKDAYYQTKSGTTVIGVSYPGSADQPPIDFPITDEMITQMENDAAVGGTYSSPCTITSPTTWSARKITCSELVIKDVLTLTGMIWVTGNVSIQNPRGAVNVSSSLGAQSAGIIADNPSNRTSGSKIELQNSTSFAGSGTSGSYVAFISQNNSAENGGTNVAIDFQNSASGQLLLYAAHGLVKIGNTSSLQEVSAYRVELSNSANVVYSSGLANTLFVSGPGGTWTINDWKEGQ